MYSKASAAMAQLNTEAKYGDTIDFEVISDHYQKRPCISTK